MIKAKTKDHILLGLSHKNLEMLKKGHPIKFSLLEIGFTWDYTVVIFSDETEQKMMETMKSALAPDAIVKDDRHKSN